MQGQVVSSQDKKIASRFIEALGKGDTNTIAEMTSTQEAPNGRPAPQQAFQQWSRNYRSAFPDLFLSLRDSEIAADDDIVAGKITGHGTHKSEWQGMSPTNRQVEMNGSFYFKIRGGQIVEAEVLINPVDLMAQLGGEFSPQKTRVGQIN